LREDAVREDVPMEMERRLVGKRVWVEISGQRRQGTVSSEDGFTIVIREDGGNGIAVFPKRLEGKRWGLLEDEDGPKVR
jgi:hypothetical protein